MVEFLDGFPNDYDALHAEFKIEASRKKYEPFLGALIDRLLDENSPTFKPKFRITIN
jgi:hypothetical protein